MADFIFEPDECEADSPAPTRPVRLVSSGVAPTSEIPAGRTAKAHSSCYAPCPQCGVQVLAGCTPNGARLAVDPGIATYVVQWQERTPQPVLLASRGYPVHQCVQKES